MCLDNLQKFEVKQRIGYCIKIKEDNVYHSLYNHAPEVKTMGLKFGLEWPSKQVSLSCCNSYEYYNSGWHIFLSKKDAIEYRRVFAAGESLLMVRFRKILARGIETFYGDYGRDHIRAKIVISKYITLLKEVK